MKTASRDLTYNFHSSGNPPQFTVEPGEEFIAETALCTGNWLHKLEDTWSPDKTCGLNPTVVVAVAGAKPGDLLAVDILDLTPAELGYTGFITTPGVLHHQICAHDYGLNTRTVRIQDGFVHWSADIKLPIRPMIGTLGTAPAHEVLSNAKGGIHGGNMDVQEVCAGTTVYLPVAVAGALLHIGDAHAIQGDGEICGSGGIECCATARLRVRLLPQPKGLRCVRMENADYIMTVACTRDTDSAFRQASAELLAWITQDYAFSLEEAYLLMGQIMEARVTQFVNPTSTYICKMPKAILSCAKA